MIDRATKAHLHDHLRWVRETLVWTLEGLSEYNIRRPMTRTGTNVLGLVKHNAVWDALRGMARRMTDASLNRIGSAAVTATVRAADAGGEGCCSRTA